MIDPRVCPPLGTIELADVVRRFGPNTPLNTASG